MIEVFAGQTAVEVKTRYSTEDGRTTPLSVSGLLENIEDAKYLWLTPFSGFTSVPENELKAQFLPLLKSALEAARTAGAYIAYMPVRYAAKTSYSPETSQVFIEMVSGIETVRGEECYCFQLATNNTEPEVEIAATAPASIDLKKTSTQELKQQVLTLLNLPNAKEAAKWAKQQGMVVDLCYKAHWALVLEKAQQVVAA